MKHYDFLSVVSQLVSSGWGREAESADVVEKQLVDNPEKLAAFALVEMLRRFDSFAEMMSSKRPDTDDNDRPEWAVKLDGIKVGDHFFTGDMLSGIDELVCVGVDDEGYVQCVELGLHTDWIRRVRWNSDSLCFLSFEACIRHACDVEMKRLMRQVAFCKRCAAAMKNGDDLAEFRKGYPDEDLPD